MSDYLIIGAEGQLGSELTRTLAREGLDHVGFGHGALDVTSPTEVEASLDRHTPSVVINCAAYNAVDAAEDDRDAAYALNRDAPAHLANACARRGALLVHFSTDYVFDGRREAAYVEVDPPRPLGVYGASKLAGEQAVVESQGSHLVLRVSWVFGRIGTSFVDDVLAWAKRGPLRIVTDQRSVPCDATRLAGAVVRASRAMVQDPSLGGLYHFAMGQPVTRYEFASEIMRQATALGLVAPVAMEAVTSDVFATRAQRPCNSVLDGTRFATTFGVDCGDWRDGLREYLETLAE